MKKPCDASQTIAESVSTGKRSGELSEWVEKTSVMDGGGGGWCWDTGVSKRSINI